MKLKPIKKPRRYDNNPSSLWGFFCGISLAQPDAFLSMTNVEDGSDIDFISPLESSCNISIRRPDQELESKIKDFNLSREALYVLDLVLETPVEAIEFLYTPASEYITRVRLLKYLRNQLKWTPRKVRRVFFELGEYVGGIGE